MKIGILTLVLHSNYGGILQAYALQTVLERMGHEVVVLNKPQKKPKVSFPIIVKRIIKKILGNRVIIFKEAKSFREAPIINRYIIGFREQYIHEKLIESFNEVGMLNLDCIVVGSDQVWRPKYFKEQWQDNISNAYLSFTKDWNIKRIAYAASLGVDEWEYSLSETESIRECISKIVTVSVREQSAVNIFKKIFNKEVSLVLDPTMLLSKEDYIKFALSSGVKESSGNLLVYFLNNEDVKNKIVNNIVKKNALKPFAVNNTGVPSNASLERRIKPSMESWLRGFYDAEFVVTDSFHACVFSILFNKQFVVIGNKERGMSRFNTLLSTFGLESRLISGLEDLNNLNEIDYRKVNVILAERRNESMHFLCNALQS